MTRQHSGPRQPSDQAGLNRLRREGTRPVGPIVITEDYDVYDWARMEPVGLFSLYVHPASELGEHAHDFAALEVLIVTHRPFLDWQSIVSELISAGARGVQLIDRQARHTAQTIIEPKRRK